MRRTKSDDEGMARERSSERCKLGVVRVSRYYNLVGSEIKIDCPKFIPCLSALGVFFVGP
jgi:hypothetical protein